MEERLNQEDLSDLKKYFNLELNDLTDAKFREALKEARKKYHPDNFSKFENEVVLEMAQETFKKIEVLSKKLEDYLQYRKSFDENPLIRPDDPRVQRGTYATEGIHIDIMTSDKRLKHQLFGSGFIYRGDSAAIRGTKAKIYSLSDHSSVANMGFRETVKVLLAFEETDSVYDIVNWLFTRISGRTTSFVIEGKVVRIDPYEILKAIQKHSLKELGSGE